MATLTYEMTISSPADDVLTDQLRITPGTIAQAIAGDRSVETRIVSTTVKPQIISGGSNNDHAIYIFNGNAAGGDELHLTDDANSSNIYMAIPAGAASFFFWEGSKDLFLVGTGSGTTSVQLGLFEIT